MSSAQEQPVWITDLVVILDIGLTAIAASGALALVLWALGAATWSLLTWLFLSPLIYFAWLLLLMSTFVARTTLARLYYSKPRKVEYLKGEKFPVVLAICLEHYTTGAFLFSLPAAPWLQHLPILKLLIFRCYATHCNIDKEAVVYGTVWDPDITHIEESALVGDGCRIVAHSVTAKSDGRFIYQFAPIVVRRGATIGGGSQIELGATIGEYAMVEPCSRVAPFTRIPPGEIWGGSPAVFLRRREGDSAPEPPRMTNSPGELMTELCALVEDALNLSSGTITTTTGAENCSAWDSLGCLAIASAVETRYGVRLDPAEIFALRDMAQLADLIHNSGFSPQPASALPSDPELLPLMNSRAACQALAAASHQLPEPAGPRFRVAIAATFVAQPLEEILRLWGRAFGISVDPVFAGFNQIIPSLLSPDGLFNKEPGDLNLILCRPEDLCSLQNSDGQSKADLMLDAIASYASASTKLLVSDLPPLVSKHVSESRCPIRQMREHWKDRLEKIPGIQLFDFSTLIEQVGTDNAWRPELESTASVPYSIEVFQLLGIAIARQVRARRTPPKKVIAVDGDGTMWGGVLGEDGPEHTRFEGGYLALQQHLRQLKEDGLLIALVSKNEEQDVWNLLDSHPRAVLRREDFVSSRIGWTEKSESLKDLSKELNLGLDAFVFIDDNPVERAKIEIACPSVTVVPLPADPVGYPDALGRLWCFDGAGATNEDRMRNVMMKQEEQRRTVLESGIDLATYLETLDLRVVMKRATENDLERVSQLTQKTNQFNLTLHRRNLDEIKKLSVNGASIWAISATDRFGDYGTVGVAITTKTEQAHVIELDSFLLSCRILGRGVEEALLHGVCRTSRDSGGKQLVGSFTSGPRNQPVIEFFTRQGWIRPGTENLLFGLEAIPELPVHITFEIV